MLTRVVLTERKACIYNPAAKTVIIIHVFFTSNSVIGLSLTVLSFDYNFRLKVANWLLTFLTEISKLSMAYLESQTFAPQ